MSAKLRFDNEVVAISGAGQGVGRAYALELAKRGAKVVVNDLGVDPTGDGSNSTVAQKVVREIEALGGKAIANTDSVATAVGGKAIVQAALDTWGRIDAVIHNAGILRDASFAKLDIKDFEQVLRVHLFGAIYLAQPAFRYMKDSGNGGRIVLTTSSSGLFGQFGQSSYAAAKMGLVGLVGVLAIEGAKHNIKVNAVAPSAITRLTGGKDADDESVLSPRKMTATGVVLTHKDCPNSGEVFRSGGGWVARCAVKITDGRKAVGEDAAEELLENWDDVREGKWSEPRTAIELTSLLKKGLGVEGFVF